MDENNKFDVVGTNIAEKARIIHVLSSQMIRRLAGLQENIF